MVDKQMDRVEKKIDDLTEVVVFMKDHMVTKEELQETLKEELDPIKNRLISVEKKVEGIYKLNDVEVQKRTDLGKRVTRLEEKVLD